MSETKQTKPAAGDDTVTVPASLVREALFVAYLAVTVEFSPATDSYMRNIIRRLHECVGDPVPDDAAIDATKLNHIAADDPDDDEPTG